jgi:cob(I)alamin adenosyltransferase
MVYPPAVKIYTRGGDRGETGLIGGARVSKSALRVIAYGEVDELNAVLGVVLAEISSPEHRQALAEIQRTLFELGAELATLPENERSRGTAPVQAERVAGLEAAIDAMSERLPPLRHFILPGGSRTAAGLHLARTVCRRAERAVVELAAKEQVGPQVIAYLNRLSDYLFVLARVVNAEGGIAEPIWRGRENPKA